MFLLCCHSGAFSWQSFLLSFFHGGVLSLGISFFSVFMCLISGISVVVLVIFLSIFSG